MVEFALVSNSSKLTVCKSFDPRNPVETFTIDISKDETHLMITSSEFAIHRVDLFLRKGEEDDIQYLSTPIRYVGTTVEVRIDLLFPLVFKEKEEIILIPKKALSLFADDKLRNQFELHVKISNNCQYSMNSPKPELTIVHSAEISIPNGEKIAVSKELLILSSEFFRSLFEGNYAEKNTGLFEIKDVDPEEFRWFINSLHSRNWEFSSGDHAMLALRYADQYGLLRLHRYILPYLKSNTFYKIRIENIEDTFLLCSRFLDSCELLRWVLSNVETDREMFDLVYRCVPLMQTTSVQVAIKALEESVIDLKKQEISEEKLNVLTDTRTDSKASVHLVCYQQPDTIILEDFFTVDYVEWIPRTIYLEKIWDRVPFPLNALHIKSCETGIEWEVFSRGVVSTYTCIGQKVIQAKAYEWI